MIAAPMSVAIAEDKTEVKSESTDNSNGDYSDSKTTKQANGTIEQESDKKSTKGHWTDKGKAVTTTRTHSMDPKGLGNKQSAEVTEKVDTHPNGDKTTTTTKSINGKTVSEDMNVAPK